MNSEIDCFHSKSKTFSFLEHHYPKAGLALMIILVGELADSFNITQNMSAPQVTDSAMMILRAYPNLKIDDVALCFTKAKQGRYGKIYNRLDSAIIFGFIDQFLADKEEQIEYYWQHNQHQLNLDKDQKLISAPDIADDKTALRWIKEITKTVNDISWRNRQLRNITTAEPVKEYLIRDIHQVFMKQFMLQYKMESWAEDIKAGGLQLITCCGKKLDVGEYVEKKHRQLMAYREKINFRWGIYPEPDLEEIRRTMKSGSPEMLSRIKQAKEKGLNFIQY